MSLNITWAPYASDYTRYMKPSTSKAGVFWATLGGLAGSGIWLEILGLAAAKVATDQTSGGIRTIMGGGLLGALALIAIALGTIAVNAMNDYSGSLASAGRRGADPPSCRRGHRDRGRVRDHAMAQRRRGSGREIQQPRAFHQLLVTPFAAVVIVDWWQRRGRPDVSRIIRFDALASGASATAALLIGFLAAVPFMNTTLFEGPLAAHVLHGGDIAYFVGFLVGGAVYAGLPRGHHASDPACQLRSRAR